MECEIEIHVCNEYVSTSGELENKVSAVLMELLCTSTSLIVTYAMHEEVVAKIREEEKEESALCVIT
jgi:hypothetical protein